MVFYMNYVFVKGNSKQCYKTFGEMATNIIIIIIIIFRIVLSVFVNVSILLLMEFTIKMRCIMRFF